MSRPRVALRRLDAVAARYGYVSIALLATLAVVVVSNAARFPPGQGYDAEHHIDYLVGLVERGAFPDRSGEYYTPPLFYALAGVVWKVGGVVGLGQPLRLVQLFDGLLALGSAVLLLELARIVYPGRRRLHVLALGFFVAAAVVAKTAAMVHPETLSLFLATAALVVAALMLRDRRLGVRHAVVLGVLLGAGQLVRAFALWTFAVVLLAFVGAVLAQSPARRALLRAGGIAAAVAILVASPWYVYQASRYTNPVFDRPQPNEALWERRPASFYVDPGLPDVIIAPYRPHYLNRFWPTLYSDGWGDYFGFFAWNAADARGPEPAVRRELVLQSLAGVLPTLVMAAGWLWLLGTSLRRRVRRETPERLLVALMPLAGLAGLLYFTVSYPTADGDVIKATYMVTTVPAWALCFALGADAVARRLPRTIRLAGLAALVAVLLLSVRFSLYGGGLGGLL